MMKRKTYYLIMAMFVLICASFLISCSSSKGPAEIAIKAAEDAVNATKAEAAKIIPDEVKSLEDSLAVVKEKFVKKEYKAALEEATTLKGKAEQVVASAKAKKEELTKKWTELSQGIPRMVTDIQSKVDSLSKARKLPAKIKKEAFEEAKAAFASLQEDWNKAQASFTGGNFSEAVSIAAPLKDKAVKIMESLGMSVPAAETPAPAASSAPAPSAVPAAK